MKTQTFDAVRYLTSPEAQTELLNDALASGDARYVGEALGVIARGRGMATVARAAGVTREALDKALSADGDPRLTTLLSVTRALGVTPSAAVAGSAPEARSRATARRRGLGDKTVPRHSEFGSRATANRAAGAAPKVCNANERKWPPVNAECCEAAGSAARPSRLRDTVIVSILGSDSPAGTGGFAFIRGHFRSFSL